MSDEYDDEPRSSFSLSSFVLGQRHQQEQQDFDNFLQRLTGRAPVARGDYNALLAHYESVVEYANELVRKVEALQQHNTTVSDDYRRLQEWAVKAEAKHAEDVRTRRELADTVNAQSTQLADLNETIEELRFEIARLRASSVRTD